MTKTKTKKPSALARIGYTPFIFYYPIAAALPLVSTLVDPRSWLNGYTLFAVLVLGALTVGASRTAAKQAEMCFDWLTNRNYIPAGNRTRYAYYRAGARFARALALSVVAGCAIWAVSVDPRAGTFVFASITMTFAVLLSILTLVSGEAMAAMAEREFALTEQSALNSKNRSDLN